MHAQTLRSPTFSVTRSSAYLLANSQGTLHVYTFPSLFLTLLHFPFVHIVGLFGLRARSAKSDLWPIAPRLIVFGTPQGFSCPLYVSSSFIFTSFDIFISFTRIFSSSHPCPNLLRDLQLSFLSCTSFSSVEFFAVTHPIRSLDHLFRPLRR